jgi:AcrR family transcriptional regulator
MNESRIGPRKSPSQERSRRTVNRILDAATRIFHEQGYTGATTNDIADEADISVGSLYQYFPNKDALLVALTQRHITTTTTDLTNLLLDLPRDSDLETTFRTVVDFLVSQHDLDDLHLLVMHQAPRTHDINLSLEHAKSHLVELTSQILRTKITDSRKRNLVARMVVATIDASVHDVILRQPRGKARQKAIDLTIATALSIIESQ